MNVIFTCGGTGGHINPAIAVANILRERHPDCNILFIGVAGEMEEKLVPQAGYKLVGLTSSSFLRSLSWDAICWNFRAIGGNITAIRECRKIMREFKPDAIIGTGGYGCFAPLYVGSKMGIPTLIHESNAVPGLTTKMVADRVDKVLVSFPDSVKQYKHPERVSVVGMPVRREFIYTKKEQARQELGLDSRPLVVSAFGSLGAKMMNAQVAEMFALEQKEGFPFQHIHATGKHGWEWMPDRVKELGVDLTNAPGLDMREYIYNMPTVMAAADVIISRAGASTCNEIAASGTPCILIPSPNVTNNHQEKNARVLSDRGAAELLLEKDCSAETIYETVKKLLADPERCKTMRKALQDMAVPDSAEQICDILEDLIRG